MICKKNSLMVSVIFGLICLSLVVFLIYPIFKGIRTKSQELSETKKELFLLQKRTTDLKEIQGRYDEWTKSLERIENLFIDPEVPIDLIKFWEQTAQQTGITIEIAPSLSNTEKETWDSVGFQLSLQGSFNGFLEFLKKVETSPYLIKIDNLMIKKITEKDFVEGSFTKGVNVNMTTIVYTK
tara:strand:- start:138 stop:683 length:546 start_codon:yes stop_codon:yes gene_type:complete